MDLLICVDSSIVSTHVPAYAHDALHASWLPDGHVPGISPQACSSDDSTPRDLVASAEETAWELLKRQDEDEPCAWPSRQDAPATDSNPPATTSSSSTPKNRDGALIFQKSLAENGSRKELGVPLEKPTKVYTASSASKSYTGQSISPLETETRRLSCLISCYPHVPPDRQHEYSRDHVTHMSHTS